MTASVCPRASPEGTAPAAGADDSTVTHWYVVRSHNRIVESTDADARLEVAAKEMRQHKHRYTHPFKDMIPIVHGSGAEHKRLEPRDAPNVALEHTAALELVGCRVQLPVPDRAVRAAAKQRRDASARVRRTRERQDVERVRERQRIVRVERERRRRRVLEVPAAHLADSQHGVHGERAVKAGKKERAD
jgi:hypothetical protein